MNSSEKKKLFSALAVMLLAVGYLYYQIMAPSSKTPDAGNAESKRQSALKSLTGGAADSAASNSSKKGRKVTADTDATLRLDLIRKLQAVNYEGSDRNIFQFYTPPPPPPVQPTHAVLVGPQQPPPPPRPAEPPPPPPIPLKFYGLATGAGILPKKIFLQSTNRDTNEDIFIAQEGDLINKRYKVVKINDTNVEMEDTTTNSKQRLPLVES